MILGSFHKLSKKRGSKKYRVRVLIIEYLFIEISMLLVKPR